MAGTVKNDVSDAKLDAISLSWSAKARTAEWRHRAICAAPSQQGPRHGARGPQGRGPTELWSIKPAQDRDEVAQGFEQGEHH